MSDSEKQEIFELFHKSGLEIEEPFMFYHNGKFYRVDLKHGTIKDDVE